MYKLVYIFSEWRVIEKHYISLCNTLPCNCQLIINKLCAIPMLFKDGREQFSKLMSSLTDSRNFSEKIITFLIIRLCYCNNGNSTSLVKLCDVMDELIDPTGTPTCMQQIRSGM